MARWQGRLSVAALRFTQRFFRGAMPASLRVAVESQIQTLAVTPQTVNTVAMGMLGFALGSPQFGAVR